MQNKTCCVTGHRDIPADKQQYIKDMLKKEIVQAIENGYTTFISGFAEGVNLFFAEIVCELKKLFPHISLEAALPYNKRLQ